MQLEQFIKENIETHQNVLIAKELFNQLATLYSIILNVLQDIENSLTFCKLHILHPSIIKSHSLQIELSKIYEHYKGEFPIEPTSENLFEIEKLITINCKLEKTKINYFIEIPINFETDFDLYHLIPIPTIYKSEYVTVIPNNEYFLKSKTNQIKSLNGMCTKGKTYQCPNKLQYINENSCEQNIILKNTNQNCQYIGLNIKQNHVENLDEINQVLAVFPKQDTIHVICQHGDEIRKLQGIFLLKENNCKFKYHGEELKSQYGTFGKPITIEDFSIEINFTEIPKMKIEINKI